MEVFSRISDVKPKHLPYRTGNDAFTNVLDGQVPLAFLSLALSLPYIAQGKIRAIATTGETRNRNLPDVPTFAEAGARGMSVLEWVGLLAPAGTPASIVSAAGQLVLNATTDSSVEERFAQSGYVRASLVGRDFDNFTAAEFRPDGLEGPDCCPKKPAPI